MAEDKYSYEYDHYDGIFMQEIQVKRINGIYCIKVNIVNKMVVKLLDYKNLTWHVNGEIHGSYTPIYPIEKAKEYFSEGTHSVAVQKLGIYYTPSVEDYTEENGMLTPMKQKILCYKGKYGFDLKLVQANTELSTKYKTANLGRVFINGIYLGEIIYYQYEGFYNKEHFLKIKNWADPELLEFFNNDERYLSEVMSYELHELCSYGSI